MFDSRSGSGALGPLQMLEYRSLSRPGPLGWGYTSEQLRVCVCMFCVCILYVCFVCVCVRFVCVCVREREREKGREKEQQIERRETLRAIGPYTV